MTLNKYIFSMQINFFFPDLNRTAMELSYNSSMRTRSNGKGRNKSAKRTDYASNESARRMNDAQERENACRAGVSYSVTFSLSFACRRPRSAFARVFPLVYGR